jgi:hypothetical protein
MPSLLSDVLSKMLDGQSRRNGGSTADFRKKFLSWDGHDTRDQTIDPRLRTDARENSH